MAQNEIARKRFGKIDLVLSVYTEDSGRQCVVADWCDAGVSVARAKGLPCGTVVAPHNENLFANSDFCEPDSAGRDLANEYRRVNYDSVKVLTDTLTANLFAVGDRVYDGEEYGTVSSINGCNVLVCWESGDEWEVLGNKITKIQS